MICREVEISVGGSFAVPSMGSGGFEKMLIGTLGPREEFLRVAKGRAAKNSVLASGAKHTSTMRASLS